MKRFFVLICILVLSVGVVLAEDMGITVGAEFTLGNVTKANDEEWNPVLMPSIAYETSFGDLDFSTELDYYFDLQPDFDNLSQYLDLDIELTYNLGLGSASTLSFILENEFNDFTIPPRSEGNYFTGIFTPGVKFNQELGIGDIYARVTAPIAYIQETKGADPTVDLNSRLGWDSAFGLGLYAQVNSSLVPTIDFYEGLDVDVSYETDLVYFEILASIGKKISDGILIEPWFECYFESFTFYAYCYFDGIAAEGGGAVTISPALGVKFSF